MTFLAQVKKFCWIYVFVSIRNPNASLARLLGFPFSVYFIA